MKMLKLNHRLTISFVLCVFCACNKSATPGPAQLGTVKVMSAGINSAIVSTNVISTGNSIVSARGICWSPTETLPSLDNSHFSTYFNSGQNSYNDTLTGLTYNTKYYVRSYITNQSGTWYSAVDSFKSLPSKYTVGQQMQGGNVLYIDSTGEHGLIAAKSMYVVSRRWSGDTRTKLGVTQFDYGAGLSNTVNIINAGNNGSETAAVYCNSLVADGYDDWFLPSYEEMWLFRNNLTFVQWLSYPWNIYWSSSEANGREAFFVVIGGMASYNTEAKDQAYSVLPMRRY